MIIILPNSNKYTSPLDYLNKENISLEEISPKLEYKENIYLNLLKFKYEFKADLVKILYDMGIKTAFDEAKANFKNLFKKNQMDS